MHLQFHQEARLSQIRQPLSIFLHFQQKLNHPQLIYWFPLTRLPSASCKIENLFTTFMVTEINLLLLCQQFAYQKRSSRCICTVESTQPVLLGFRVIHRHLPCHYHLQAGQKFCSAAEHYLAASGEIDKQYKLLRNMSSKVFVTKVVGFILESCSCRSTLST